MRPQTSLSYHGAFLLILSNAVGCNIALMSFASSTLKNETSATNYVSEVGVTSWKGIVDGVAVLLDTCTRTRGTGGAGVISSCVSIYIERKTIVPVY